jgi:hypothetical protein
LLDSSTAWPSAKGRVLRSRVGNLPKLSFFAGRGGVGSGWAYLLQARARSDPGCRADGPCAAGASPPDQRSATRKAARHSPSSQQGIGSLCFRLGSGFVLPAWRAWHMVAPSQSAQAQQGSIALAARGGGARTLDGELFPQRRKPKPITGPRLPEGAERTTNHAARSKQVPGRL